MARISKIVVAANAKHSRNYQTGGGAVEITVELGEGETLETIADKLGKLRAMAGRMANDQANDALAEALYMTNAEELEKRKRNDVRR